jgi:site-specific DNA-methyltransferase (adenine-specific)
MTTHIMENITLHHRDCMEAMREMDDNSFDLAVVDPPYQISTSSPFVGAGKLANRTLNKSSKINDWDVAPTGEYFDQLMRVSRHQIIWGGNYFDLPPTRCVIAWDKCQPWPNFSAWEMAWTSFDKPAKLFKYDNRTSGKIHPTQKPVRLYEWILETFGQPNWTILDTHFGSGSHGIACHNVGHHLTAFEVDDDYVTAAVDRISRHQIQLQLPW